MTTTLMILIWMSLKLWKNSFETAASLLFRLTYLIRYKINSQAVYLLQTDYFGRPSEPDLSPHPPGAARIRFVYEDLLVLGS